MFKKKLKSKIIPPASPATTETVVKHNTRGSILSNVITINSFSTGTLIGDDLYKRVDNDLCAEYQTNNE